MRPISRSRSSLRDREGYHDTIHATDSYKETLSSFMDRGEHRERGGPWTPRSSQSGGRYAGPSSYSTSKAMGGTSKEERLQRLWATATPPRSRSRGRPYHLEDERNPTSEGRTSGFGRSNSSVLRDRPRGIGGYDDMANGHNEDVVDDDFNEFMGKSRDVLSKIRSDIHKGKGTYSESRSRSGSRLLSLGANDELGYDGGNDYSSTIGGSAPGKSHHSHSHHSHNTAGSATNESLRYEIMGMKEELLHFQEEIHRKEEEIARLRDECDDISKSKEEELASMKETYDQQLANVRSKLLETFKSDMQEMKEEWENAFYQLKQESESAKKALEKEVKSATTAKAELEGQMSEMTAEYQSRLEDEKRKSEEMVEEMKKSKEEDLERLRSMYEEHIEDTKRKQVETENDLKEEVNCLLDENEKVKMCYDRLEEEMSAAKRELDELSAEYKKCLSTNARFEKELSHYKEEVDDLMEENKGMKKRCNALDDEMSRVKEELQRMTSSYQRADAEKAKFEKELDLTTKEKDDIVSNYRDLVQKLNNIQEERELETRYTEALVKQRDNMSEIIENNEHEIKELKKINKENEEIGAKHQELQKEYSKVKERVETLTRERERYNATVKALKVDLQALHLGNIGAETSLQEHMRVLNEKWDEHLTIKSDLQKSTRALEEARKDREHMAKQHNAKLEELQQDMDDARSTISKLERAKMELEDKVVGYEVADSKKKRIHEEMEHNMSRLENQLAYLDEERKEHEAQKKQLESERDSLQNELDKTCSRLKQLEEEFDNIDDVKSGMTQKVEAAYDELEEAQREMNNMRQDHEQEIRALESELDEVKALRAKNSTLEDTIESQEEEIKFIKERLARLKNDQSHAVEEAQNEVAESYKAQISRLEEMHAEEIRSLRVDYHDSDTMKELRAKNRELEATLQEYKEQLEQNQMAEVKRRGEFAKQRQELEILRSKEKHLDAHVCQLEEHISKVVSDYESKLQQSGSSVMSNTEVEKALRKQVRELEKKLEVSSAAMKQLGKSSLLMEKENERLKHDKTELKQKLKKLVDCAERFTPKK
mmetsp:Transcript_19328/g.37641  ORF Transcript_19328/g.37641 Transcript_19328/m.37641 type:complete len:1058 (-) Transcript_19328:117-3290(-)